MIKKDAIIIGTGQAAKPLSQKLSKAGWQVLMVEKNEEMLGGTCLNIGCTPSKTLIASAQRMQEMRTAAEHGIHVSLEGIDFTETQKRKDKLIEDSKEALKKRIQEAKNLELIYGLARFIGKKTISIKKENGEEEEYTAPYIFIDTGTDPHILKISGLEGVNWYDSTGILALEKVPEKLMVVGGGYIGLELGQMYRRFGSEVTIVERSKQITAGEDADVAESIQKLLETEGIKIMMESSVDSVEQVGKEIKVLVKASNGKEEHHCTHLLLATGRQPNTDELNVKASGIELTDKGYIRVNDKLETNVEGIYALGDINGGPAFTHIAYNDFVIVSQNILEKKDVSTKGRPLPYCMYTDPQLGRIGLSEEDARAQGLDIKVVKIDGSRISRGIETGKPQGIWKAIVDNQTREVLGAAIISSEGGEIASVIQMAMEGGMKADDLATAIFSHPSYSESINTLFEEFGE